MRTCRACLGRAETRAWLQADVTVIDGCLLTTRAQQATDGRYRVTVMSHDGEGATKTSATVHHLFNELWGFKTDNVTDLQPTVCGHWNCINRWHWDSVPRLSDRARLKEWAQLMEAVVGSWFGEGVYGDTHDSDVYNLEVALEDWRRICP